MKKKIGILCSFIILFFIVIISIINNPSVIKKLKGNVTGTQPMLGNAVEYISSLAGDSDSTSTDVITGTDMAYDPQGNLRYVGSDPHNYIKFNDELWQILGVVEVDGVKRLKLIRNNNIGYHLSFDKAYSYADTLTNNYGESSLMKLLNPGYEDNINTYLYNSYQSQGLSPDDYNNYWTNGVYWNNSLYWNRQEGSCYENGDYYCDYRQTGLKEDYKKLISKVNWNVGHYRGNEFDIGTSLTTSDIYNIETSKTWEGYVGLPSYTDIAYAISNEYADRNECLTKATYWMAQDKCFKNQYIAKKTYSETATVSSQNWNVYSMLLLFSFETNNTPEGSGTVVGFWNTANRETETSFNIATFTAYSYNGVWPSVYLNPDVTLRSGTGTHDDPYIIGMTYNARFNDEERITDVTVEQGNSVDPIDSQGKEGHTFKHWSLTKNGEAYNFSTILTESITLYAVYEANDVTVEFYDKNDNHIKTLTTKYDTMLDLYELPTIDDDEFVGWREKGSKNNFNFDSTIKRNYKLYAKVVSDCNNVSKGVKFIRNKKDNNELFDDPHGNLRYRGKNANNYISFNGELWRIVGTFKVKDKFGISNEKIKIVRNDPIEPLNIVYDSSPSNINNGSGVNEWSQADIMKLMNPGYENEQVGGSLYWNKASGNCYIGTSNANTPCDFTSNGLSDEAKQYIETVIWNTSAIPATAYNMSVSEVYEAERDNKTYRYNMPENLYSTPDDLPRTYTWLGKVGLLYDSDIEYSANSVDGHTYDECMSSTTTNNYCKRDNSWFITGGRYRHYTITPAYGESPYYIILEGGGGSITYGMVSNTGYGSNPTLYLKSNVNIVSGTGTHDDPYEIDFYEAEACKEDVKVTFNDEGRITEKTIDKDTKVESIDSQGKEGHTFKHWSLDKQNAFDFDTNIHEDITLYAMYNINKYNVEFYDEELLDTQIVEYNKKINTSNIPIVEKDGYEFIGWKEQESEDNFDFEIKIKKNYKLYANYKKIEEPSSCELILTSDKYEIDNKNYQINRVPEKETVEEMKKHFSTKASDIRITTEKVTITCDDNIKVYKINRVKVLSTGQLRTRYGILIILLTTIVSLLLVSNKKRIELNSLKKIS